MGKLSGVFRETEVWTYSTLKCLLWIEITIWTIFYLVSAVLYAVLCLVGPWYNQITVTVSRSCRVSSSVSWSILDFLVIWICQYLAYHTWKCATCAIIGLSVGKSYLLHFQLSVPILFVANLLANDCTITATSWYLSWESESSNPRQLIQYRDAILPV